MLSQALSSVLPDRISRAALVEAYDEEYDRCRLYYRHLSHYSLKTLCIVLNIKMFLPMHTGIHHVNTCRCYMAIMRKKLGLLVLEEEADSCLVSDLLDLMKLTGSDFTNTFRLLSAFPMGPMSSQTPVFNSSSEGSGGTESHIDGPIIETVISGRAETSELVRMSASRMPMAQLQMLSMLVHRDAALLHAMGMSAQVGQQMAFHIKAHGPTYVILDLEYISFLFLSFIFDCTYCH